MFDFELKIVLKLFFIPKNTFRTERLLFAEFAIFCYVLNFY